jgi:hypothetical protein
MFIPVWALGLWGFVILALFMYSDYRHSLQIQDLQRQLEEARTAARDRVGP